MSPENPVSIVGYGDDFSVRPGSTLTFRVHSEAPRYEASVVRLIHGDARPEGPGLKAISVQEIPPQMVDGRLQRTSIGSFGRVPLDRWQPARQMWTIACWIWPTVPRYETQQNVMSLLWPDSRRQVCLQIQSDGALALRVDHRAGVDDVVRCSKPLKPRSWYLVAGVVDQQAGYCFLYQRQRPGWPAQSVPDVVRKSCASSYPARPSELLLAAGRRDPDSVGNHFNGKLDTPMLFNDALSQAQIEELSSGGISRGGEGSGLVWNLSSSIDTSSIVPVSATGIHGTLVNLPTRGVTGHLFDGTSLDFRIRPEHFGAVHFHDDDLEDAGWEPSFELKIPEEMPSGLYAAELTAAGARQHIPFIVTPEPGRTHSQIAVLLPTLTYLAYGNERLSRDETIPRVVKLSPTDHYLLSHPELGLSLYDVHSDGSGVCFASRRRPILNMSPAYRWWLTGSPAHLAADLFLLDWLTEKGFAHDVVSDEDVHEGGLDVLAQYGVVITGSHPEYTTGAMLDALNDFLEHGGKLMYLGGNGFYWVTSLDRSRPYIMEVRRGLSGTRTWTSAPGEQHHATTGEPGGLWRHRGHPPNLLTGVGFTAQGAGDRAPGFTRLPDSFLPEVRFIFEGVSPDEVIGDFGLALGGAAGHEIDRLDESLGSPEGVFHLATSLPHSDLYQATVEDQQSIRGSLGGASHKDVRADMTYFEHPDGGAVFSVGAITWSGSLSHNDYENNVSLITQNVLVHFLSELVPTVPR